MADLHLEQNFLNSQVHFSNNIGRTLEEFDALVVVADKLITDQNALHRFEIVNAFVSSLSEVDNAAQSSPMVFFLPNTSTLQVRRLIFSPTGSLDRDFDDVRRYEEAAYSGLKRAIQAGSRRPYVYIDVGEKVRSNPVYELAEFVSVLGALRATYVPLEIREAKQPKKVDILTFHLDGKTKIAGSCIEDLALALETGRIVARDIGGSDPERMSAPRVVDYVKQTFQGSKEIKIEIIQDQHKLEKEFPLLGAVNRAASVIERHQARVILLEYTGSGEATNNIFLVGKGITYDSGGADVKTGGIMVGMHRDKCAAAAVAGFFKVLSILKPPGIRVVGACSMVRNSIGENCYVADEIITSRAGVRVRVDNTDAEGRMVIADLLCYMKERILKEKPVNPQVYAIATLTEHAITAMGTAYSAVLDNGPALKKGNSRALFEVGAKIAEPVEISTIRREDYEAHKGASEYEDIMQCSHREPGWSRTIRGHQSPAAFLLLASGLDKHGTNSDFPIPYTHIDIAGSCGPFPGYPTATPLLMLATHHILPHL